MQRHPLLAAIVVWLVLANAGRTALRLGGGADRGWWIDLVLIAFSLHGVGAAWYLHTARRPVTARGPDVSLIVFATGVSPILLGIAGAFLGASAWTSWFTAFAMACGLAAWVRHERMRTIHDATTA